MLSAEKETQPRLGVLCICPSQLWQHSGKNWGSLDKPKARAALWPIKSESLQVGLRYQHFSKTFQARLRLYGLVALLAL